MDSQKSVWVALVAVAILALVAIALPKTIAVQTAQVDGSQPSFGGVTNYDEVDTTALRVGGANSARLGFVNVVKGNLVAYTSYTVAASTTVAMDVAVPGMVSGDIVFAQFATSSTPGNGWEVTGASASSTAGFATLRVTNWTGASNLIPASIASSTQVEDLRLRTSVPGL